MMQFENLLNRYTLISLCVVLAIGIWWHYGRQRNLRSEANQEFGQSNGTFDEHAKNALRALDKIERPTAKDKFLSARVIDLNGHEGRINNVRVLNDVVDRYMYNLLDDDGLDWFELDQIENFAERHQDIINEHPRYEAFRETMTQQRPKMVRATLEEAKSAAANKAEAFAHFIDDNVQHTDDSQNVHDSAVNEQLRSTYSKLLATTPADALEKATKEVPSSVRAHINRTLDSTEDRVRAGKALDALMKGRYNATLGANEHDLLKLVWARSCMGTNFTNKSLIRDAVVQGLRDMADKVVSSDGVVCSNGRIARLLESLLFTDQDDGVVQGVMTTEQIRNDVMERSGQILKQTIEEFTTSSPATFEEKNSKDNHKDNDEESDATALVQVARSYVDPDIQTDPAAEAQFKKLVQEKIEKVISGEYAHRLSQRDFQNIRDHCVAAIQSM